MPTSLCFNEITLAPVPHQGGLWIQARNLANALGYKDERSVHKIYERNKDEFSSMMSAVVNLTTGIIEVPTRIFSLRGCHLIAMFARTPVAKQFRRWVLDVLDKLAAEERAQLHGDVKPKREPVRLPATSSSSRKSCNFYCTDTQMRPLNEAVNAWAKRSKMSRLEALRRVREHFGINRFWTWPVERMESAIAWVRQQSALAAPALPALPAEVIPADMPVSFKTALADVNKWAGQWGGTVNWLHIACRPRKARQHMLPEDQALFDALEELNAVAVTSAQAVRFALRAMHALGRDMRRAEIADR